MTTSSKFFGVRSITLLADVAAANSSTAMDERMPFMFLDSNVQYFRKYRFG